MKNIATQLFKYYTGNDSNKYNPDTNEAIRNLAVFLKDKHCTIQDYFININQYYSNLLAYKPNKNKYILLQGHLDTFPVIDNNYKYEITDSHIIGRGAVDMKGSLIGMIDAFIKTYNNDSEYSPMLLLTTNEETNNFAGIKHFLKNKPSNVKFAINGEPNNFKLSTEMNGVMMCDYEDKALNGHSSNNKISIIERNIELLSKVKVFCGKAREIQGTKASITILNSGHIPNQFPEEFKLHFHLRTSSEHTVYKNIDKNLLDTFKLTEYEPANATIPTNLKHKFDSLQRTRFNAFSEANILNTAGINTIILGIGDLSLAHSKPERERITFNEIEKYSNFLQSLFQ